MYVCRSFLKVDRRVFKLLELEFKSSIWKFYKNSCYQYEVIILWHILIFTRVIKRQPQCYIFVPLFFILRLIRLGGCCCLLKQGTTKINLAVDHLPQFKCCKLGHPDSGPQHVGTIHIGSERYPINFVFIIVFALNPCAMSYANVVVSRAHQFKILICYYTFWACIMVDPLLNCLVISIELLT